MKQIVAVLLVLYVSNASANFWRVCHINLPTPISVTSPHCTATDCTVTRGQQLIGTVTFTSPATHNDMELHVRFQAGPSLWLPIHLEDPNMCPHITPGGCPTQPNIVKTLNINIPIPTNLDPANGVPFELFLTSLSPTISDVVCWQQTVTLL